LGNHFCRALAEAGSKVAIFDIDQAALKTLENEINQQHPASAIGITVDVTNPEAVAESVRSVVDILAVLMFFITMLLARDRIWIPTLIRLKTTRSLSGEKS